MRDWFKDTKKQNIISVIIILLALLAILFQDQIWDWWQMRKLESDPRIVVAEFEDITKNVKFRVPDSLSYFRAKKSIGLRAKDTVSTDMDSRAVIKFKSGLKVELEPNSLIIVDDYGSGPGQLELTFLRGGVKILDQGLGPKVKLPAQDLNKKEQAKIDFNQLFNNQEGLGIEDKSIFDKDQKAKAKKETLPESYIVSVIRNQKNFLYRCYAQHLRLNPDARGRIDTSFTIEPDGTVSSARVIGSTIPDPTLQQCVVSTLARVRFKSFNGDPMIVTYPIHFD
ncbi:MAG: AgmX/PglI C-terminal domain-containing protein [Oligoflexia bacterium]|nr:AgmX/PglI C-terminal domain-containing protein [Oligoflexia bacterium]